MKPWELRTPYAVLAFSASTPQGAEFLAFLEKLPGVMRQRSGVWWIPDNVLGAVAAEQTRLNVAASAKWGVSPKPEKSWEEIHEFLRQKGEIREEFLGDWLKPYQKVGIQRAWSRPGFCLFHATGSGKTATGLIAATSQEGPILVVTRASVRRQYYREIERFTNCKAYVMLPESQMAPRVTVGGVSWPLFRERQIAEKIPYWQVRENWAKLKAERGVDRRISLEDYLTWCRSAGQRPFVVVAWENLTDRMAELEALRPGTLVLDESHTARNSKRYLMTSLKALPADPAAAHKQALQEFLEAKAKNGFLKTNEETGERMMFTPLTTTAAATSRLARLAKKVIGTTATPVSNRVADLWSQLDAVEPNAHGPSAKWLDRYAGRKPGKYGGFEAKGETNRSELELRLKTVAHVVSKAEAAKFMPAVRRVSMYIGPEALTRPSAGFNAELKRAAKRGATAVLEVRLAMAAAMKRPALLDLVVEHLKSGNKVAVFTGRRKDCDLLGEEIKKAVAKELPDCTVWAAHGEMGTEARQAIVDEVMAHPGPCCLVGTGDAFGTGVNLDTMDTVIFAQLPYTPEKIIQQEGRFSRNSTMKNVVYYYVIAEGTVDEHVACILLDKLPTAQRITGDEDLHLTMDAIAGKSPEETEASFAAAILSCLDLD